jgi:putative tricarboxylic transport membrane protein
VVLGDNAEINLIRALATDDNLLIFFMRPWSLFFLMIAAFSVAFPWFQKYRGKKKWTLFFSPFLALSLSIPMFMMGGEVRPIIAVGLICIGLYVLYRRHRGGWELKAVGADEHQLREG